MPFYYLFVGEIGGQNRFKLFTWSPWNISYAFARKRIFWTKLNVLLELANFFF